MKMISRSYQKSLIMAVLFHIVLIVALVIELPKYHQHYRYDSGTQKTPIVQATAINPSAVSRAMQQIQLREQQKQREAAQHLAALKAAAHREQLRQQVAAKRAAAHMAQLKAEQLHLKQQHQAEENALMALQKQAQRYRERQEVLKRERIHQAKLLAAKKKQARLVAEQKHNALLAKQKQLQQRLLQQQLAGDSEQLHQVQSAEITGVVNKYAVMIKAAIEQNWLIPAGVNKQLACVYDVKLAPGGVVLSVQLLKSSGNSAFDQSARTAIYKASPLPVPKDPTIFDNLRDLQLTLSPKEVINS